MVLIRWDITMAPTTDAVDAAIITIAPTTVHLTSFRVTPALSKLLPVVRVLLWVLFKEVGLVRVESVKVKVLDLNPLQYSEFEW